MFDVKLNEDELGYITAYLGAAIERMESNMNSSSVTVALVSNTNHGTSTLLMARIKSKFSNKFNLVGPYSAYSLDEIMKDNPCLLYTSAFGFRIIAYSEIISWIVGAIIVFIYYKKKTWLKRLEVNESK